MSKQTPTKEIAKRISALLLRIGGLNPEAGEIGAGMLAQIVGEARAINAAILETETHPDACTHCGHGRNLHSTSCVYSGCTFRRFRKRLNIA